MNMGIGFSEIIVIVLLILLFFGSKELPRFLREGARFIAKIRAYGDTVRQELDEVTKNLDAPPPVPHDTVVADQKTELRKKFLEARKSLSPEERESKSRVILDLLANSSRFKKAGAIMMYVNFGSEVATGPLVAQMVNLGKRVLVPYCRPEMRSMGIGEIKDLDNDMVIAANKVPEPKPELRDHFFRSDLQLIVCPGVGYDHYGGRLGRGYGYYDSFLRELKGRVPFVGLAFDCQVQKENLPFSYSDVVMDQIITESGFILPEAGEGNTEEGLNTGSTDEKLAG
jgi:5-formyltetrahydrofolate cyclo-ligase